MKTIDECLDELQDDKYAYSTIAVELDADLFEGLLKSVCRAGELNDAQSALLFAKSLNQAITDEMRKFAEQHSNHSRTPFCTAMDNFFEDDLYRLNALGVRA